MKTWLNIVLFLVLAGIADRIVSFGISEAVQAREYDWRLEQLLAGNCNHKNIFLGSSRALIDINAEQVSKELNRDFFNLGFSGSHLEFQAFILDLLLRNNQPPDSVFLFVDEYRMFTGTTSTKFRTDFLAPHLHNNYVYAKYCEKTEKQYLPGIISHLYRQNKNTYEALNYLFSGKKLPDNTSDINDFGSIILDKQAPNFSKEFNSKEKDYDINAEIPLLIESFNSIFDLCKTHKIELIIVFPPNFQKPNLAFKQRIRQLYPYGVTEIVLDTLNLNASDYFDHGHLSKSGNQTFSHAFVTAVKQL